MKIGAAYIRVSTDDQLEYSPDSQIKLIQQFAKKNDIIVPEEFIFIDEGISGKTAEKRPDFNRMIAIAKQKENSFDVILVWKFSRFARNQEESIVYKKCLKR
jgi:DNA invertase Pin-like site-specific DNA recombinase